MRPAALGFLGVALVSGLLVPGQQPAQAPVFRGGTEVVTIDVSVHRRNTPVAGLTAQDFALVDNGVPQAIELQSVDTFPIDVTVVFDQNYYTQLEIGGDFASSLRKIAAVLRPIDRLRVITFARSVREVLPMQSPASWPAQGLPALEPSRTLESLRRAGRLDRSGLDIVHDPELRRWSLFDALLLALAKPPELGRRHLIVAFCVTVDSSSVATDGALLESVAARSDALLHLAIWNRRVMDYTAEGLGGLYTRLAVTAAAEATGGGVHNAPDGVAAFKSIFEDLRRSYFLRYTVTGVPRDGWHAVAVTTPRFPDYEVRARPGYLGR